MRITLDLSRVLDWHDGRPGERARGGCLQIKKDGGCDRSTGRWVEGAEVLMKDGLSKGQIPIHSGGGAMRPKTSGICGVSETIGERGSWSRKLCKVEWRWALGSGAHTHIHRHCGVIVFNRQRSILFLSLNALLICLFFRDLLYCVGALHAFHTEGAPSAFLI